LFEGRDGRHRLLRVDFLDLPPHRWYRVHRIPVRLHDHRHSRLRHLTERLVHLRGILVPKAIVLDVTHDADDFADDV
jgi:hypothetical protein